MECRRQDTIVSPAGHYKVSEGHDAFRARQRGDWRQRVRTNVLLAGRQLTESCARLRAWMWAKYRISQLGSPDGRTCVGWSGGLARVVGESLWGVVGRLLRQPMGRQRQVGARGRKRRMRRQPRASRCCTEDKVRAVAAAQVTGAPRDERSVAAVTHCQFVVGWGGG